MRNKLREQKAWNSLDQLISLCDEQRRHFETERLGGLEVDDQLELRGLLDGQVGGLGALEDLVHVGGSELKHISTVRSIGHKAPPASTNPLQKNMAGSRFFAARSTRRLRSFKSMPPGSTIRAAAPALVMSEKALSKSSGPRASTN